MDDIIYPSTDFLNHLADGTRLGKLEIKGVLGDGGFGIVYRAWNHVFKRHVAVKEYMPAELADRKTPTHVSMRSHSSADLFRLGMDSFLNEAQLLSHCEHLSLVRVYDFFEANGTAYMELQLLRGHTLKNFRQQLAQSPSEAWIRERLASLLDAIELLHEAGIFHRDIAPDNIMLEPGSKEPNQPERLVLLDFGSARQVIGEKTRLLTKYVKPAYAPIEQYLEDGSLPQGPWTDIYALGATLHHLLTGKSPPESIGRMVRDRYEPLARHGVPGMSLEFLQLVDWLLAIRPEDRPRDIATVRAVLAGRALPTIKAAPFTGFVPPKQIPQIADQKRVEPPAVPPPRTRRHVPLWAPAAIAGAVALAVVAVSALPRRNEPKPVPTIGALAAASAPASVRPPELAPVLSVAVVSAASAVAGAPSGVAPSVASAAASAVTPSASSALMMTPASVPRAKSSITVVAPEVKPKQSTTKRATTEVEPTSSTQTHGRRQTSLPVPQPSQTVTPPSWPASHSAAASQASSNRSPLQSGPPQPCAQEEAAFRACNQTLANGFCASRKFEVSSCLAKNCVGSTTYAGHPACSPKGPDWWMQRPSK